MLSKGLLLLIHFIQLGQSNNKTDLESMNLPPNHLMIYRVFYNALREIKLKYCQQGLLIGLKIGYVHVPQVGGFVFLPLE